MIINNTDVLLPLLCFDYDYYIRVIVISRYKDTGNETIWQRSFFGTKDSLNKELPTIIQLANDKKARVYIDLIPYRLSSYFLAEHEWRWNSVFGIKPQLKRQHDVPQYGLFDADSNEPEINEIVNKFIIENNLDRIIIKSSERGEHWILKSEDLKLIKEQINLPLCCNKIHTDDMVWACLYNPIDLIKKNLC
jgi:hypothetical protein